MPFFGFNVLLGYAVWAIPLLLIRRWSTRALLVTAMLSAASVPLYNIAAATYVQLTSGPAAAEALFQARRAATIAANEAVRAAEAQDSYRQLLAARLDHMAWFYTQPFFFLPSVTLALFISGLLLIRHGVLERPGDHRRVLGILAAFGVVSWLGDNWVLEIWGLDAIGLLRDQWLMFAYLAGTLALIAARPGLVAHLRPLANAGRMALTNYLLQIATLDLLFSGYALGLDAIRPILGFTAALVFFAVQAAISTLWLQHFRFGPAEWLWRSLTYGQAQPMRLRGHEGRETPLTAT